MATPPTGSRPLRTDARRNYEHILATARQVFDELGPDAPLDTIARRIIETAHAGMSLQ
jgi:hypothetical protein